MTPPPPPTAGAFFDPEGWDLLTVAHPCPYKGVAVDLAALTPCPLPVPPSHFFTDSVTVSTVAELQATIADLKRTCRPAGRGRPVKLARRTIHFNGHKITAALGEACRGSHGITMAFGLYMDGRRVTVDRIAATVAPD